MAMTMFHPLPNLQERIDELEHQNCQLRQELLESRNEANSLRREAANVTRGVQELRKLLSPLYGGLRQVFGEIDSMGVSDATGADPRKQAIWDSWKQKLPSGEGRAIDALLLHGSMTTAQLRIHVGCASRTAQNIVQALKSKGLIVKNGTQITLKEL